MSLQTCQLFHPAIKQHAARWEGIFTEFLLTQMPCLYFSSCLDWLVIIVYMLQDLTTSTFFFFCFPSMCLSLVCSSGVAQGRAAPADQHPAIHQLHPGGPDGAHQPRLLRGQGGFFQGAGGDQQELAQRRRQRETGRRESPFCWLRVFLSVHELL